MSKSDDLISRQAAIDGADEIIKRDTSGDNAVVEAMKAWKVYISNLPSAQPEPISEEYAKAVRTWLVDYQVRCAELKGRYTPYEILGWIVSDWRKENEI